jgi:hypothetical protein
MIVASIELAYWLILTVRIVNNCCHQWGRKNLFLVAAALSLARGGGIG